MACGYRIGSVSEQTVASTQSCDQSEFPIQEVSTLGTGTAFPAHVYGTFLIGLLGTLWLLAPGRAGEDTRVAVNTQQ